MYQSFEENKNFMKELLHIEESFDIVSRDVIIGDKNAVFYFVDGFCKDELMQKLLQFLMGLKADDMPENAKELNKLMPYVEVDISKDFNEIVKYIKANAKPNDIVLTLGAGTITNLGPMLVD